MDNEITQSLLGALDRSNVGFSFMLESINKEMERIRANREKIAEFQNQLQLADYQFQKNIESWEITEKPYKDATLQLQKDRNLLDKTRLDLEKLKLEDQTLYNKERLSLEKQKFEWEKTKELELKKTQLYQDLLKYKQKYADAIVKSNKEAAEMIKSSQQFAGSIITQFRNLYSDAVEVGLVDIPTLIPTNNSYVPHFVKPDGSMVYGYSVLNNEQYRVANMAARNIKKIEKAIASSKDISLDLRVDGVSVDKEGYLKLVNDAKYNGNDVSMLQRKNEAINKLAKMTIPNLTSLVEEEQRVAKDVANLLTVLEDETIEWEGTPPDLSKLTVSDLLSLKDKLGGDFASKTRTVSLGVDEHGELQQQTVDMKTYVGLATDNLIQSLNSYLSVNSSLPLNSLANSYIDLKTYATTKSVPKLFKPKQIVGEQQESTPRTPNYLMNN